MVESTYFAHLHNPFTWEIISTITCKDTIGNAFHYVGYGYEIIDKTDGNQRSIARSRKTEPRQGRTGFGVWYKVLLAKFKGINTVKNIHFLFNKLADYGFVFEGMKNIKLTENDIIISYLDNATKLTMQPFSAEKA